MRKNGYIRTSIEHTRNQCTLWSCARIWIPQVPHNLWIDKDKWSETCWYDTRIPGPWWHAACTRALSRGMRFEPFPLEPIPLIVLKLTYPLRVRCFEVPASTCRTMLHWICDITRPHEMYPFSATMPRRVSCHGSCQIKIPPMSTPKRWVSNIKIFPKT